jgi:Ca2+-binding RTX toxin-like protein
MLETLESRRLLAGDYTYAEHETGPDTMMKDGVGYSIPIVKGDGSVSLEGSTDPDTIIVERVSELGLTAAEGVMNLLSFDEHGDHDNITTLHPTSLESNQKQLLQITAQIAEEEAALAQLKESNPAAHATAEEIEIFEQRIEMQEQQLESSRNILATTTKIVDMLSTPTDFIRYRVEGVFDFYVKADPQAAGSARIRIDGAGGNDVIAVANNVKMKASIGGGSGADKLTSGSKRSILYGGGGNDRLFSRSKFGGTLDGGKGADRYFNRFGDVNIAARNDGDCVVVNNASVPVTQAGVFSVNTATPTTTGQCFFHPEGAEEKTDLLAI